MARPSAALLALCLCAAVAAAAAAVAPASKCTSTPAGITGGWQVGTGMASQLPSAQVVVRQQDPLQQPHPAPSGSLPWEQLNQQTPSLACHLPTRPARSLPSRCLMMCTLLWSSPWSRTTPPSPGCPVSQLPACRLACGSLLPVCRAVHTFPVAKLCLPIGLAHPPRAPHTTCLLQATTPL